MTTEITAYTGESVLLPCYCTDTSSTPETFTWKKFKFVLFQNQWIDSSYEIDRSRVQLFNSRSPGNLSLLISHLTEEDRGVYRCEAEGSGFTDITLTVKGCKLEGSSTSGTLLSISAYLGGSVLLPCYCTDLSTTPEEITWSKYNNQTLEEVSNESGQYRDRVQVFNSHSPGNLSLLISHLTEEDGGDYTCDSEGDHIGIRLSVQTPPGLTPTTTTAPTTTTTAPTTTTTAPTTTTSSTAVVKVPLSLSTSSTASSQTPAEHGAVTPAERGKPQSVYFLIFIPVLLLLLGLGGAIYWRYRGQCGGQSGEQRGRKREQDTADQVTYSTVVHSNNRTTPAVTLERGPSTPPSDSTNP
ncbi:uncharacterized protein [Hoplias malabaricus]|uniref:uncharacterized protein n=1 Tax=Hoplias malabaricus TaxID=27720 RepID=UPI0034635361